MQTTEKYEEKFLSFSDKRVIALQFKTIFANLRFGSIPNLIFLISCSIFVFFNMKPTVISGILIVFFGYFIILFRTLILIRKEFKQTHKLVGTFKVLGKSTYRSYYSVETKYEYIKIEKYFYNEIDVNDIIRVEKFKTGRVFNVEKLHT